MSCALILLAGGVGSRMKSATPKQFLSLRGKPIALYSLEIFASIVEIEQIVVVAAPEYRHLCPGIATFAEPGTRRQDSVFNGLASVHPKHKWILTHDAARPFITKEMVMDLIDKGKKKGAATLAVPVKPTIKECSLEGSVIKTLDRTKLVEIQTPQILDRELFVQGFKKAQDLAVTVTDDTSLAELLNHPVSTVFGSYNNIKITTPEDLNFANFILSL